MITVRPVELGDQEGLAQLFLAAGSSCFCRYWHFEGDKNEWLERLALAPEQNKAELFRAIDQKQDAGIGIVAINESGIVGWMKLARATSTPKILEQRYYRGLPVLGGDRTGWFVIGCTLVRPDARRQGVTVALLKEAAEEAKRQGGTVLFGLPRVTTEPVSDEELWMGPYRPFLEAGFSEASEEKPYPVMRLDLVQNEGSL